MATDPVTRAQIADLRSRVDDVEGAVASGVVAGAGLTGTTTHNVGANADGSITVNANDIQVGTLATDGQHGNRGGGGIHAVAVAAGAAGFLSGADKTKLDATSGTNSGDNPITAKDEGVSLTTNMQSVDFVGGGVTATTSTNAVTVTVPKAAGLTVGAVGASPNANGATLSSGALNLELASASFPGAMTAAQFSNLANQSGTNTNDVTIGTFGAVPTAKGISISGQAITLQPADASFPGAVTNGAQVIAGNKSLSGNTGVGQTGFNGYVLDFGNNGATNTFMALYNNGGAPAGMGVTSADVRFHGNSAVAGQFSFRPRAADAAVVTIDWVSGAIAMGAGSTMAAVALLSQTNVVGAITGKTFVSATHSGTLALGTSTISGTPNFSGVVTIGGVAAVSTTNSLTVSNKTFTSCTWLGSLGPYTLGGAGSITVQTGRFMLHIKQLQLTGSNLRVTLSGTARLRII